MSITRSRIILYSGLMLCLFLLLPVASAKSTTINLKDALTSPVPSTYAHFGFSIAIADQIFVGANGDDTGKVYVFNHKGMLTGSLRSPNPHFGGEFGESISASNNILVVGAPGETQPGILYTGHAYLYNTDGSLIATLTSPHSQRYGHFGYAVGIDNGTIVVGAPREGLYVYLYNTTGALLATLTCPADLSYDLFGCGWPNEFSGAGGFGSAVAIAGNNVAVGASGLSYFGFGSGCCGIAGVAYLYRHDGSLAARLYNPDSRINDYFGFSVAATPANIVVGAPGENSVYVFTHTGSWIHTITAPDPQPDPHSGFGASVAIDGNTIVVGEALGTTMGHVYVYKDYTLVATLNGDTADHGGWSYGGALGLNDKTLAVGAFGETVNGIPNAGSVYTYSMKHWHS